MFKNIKTFFEKYTKEILIATVVFLLCIAIITSIWAYTMTVLTNDLVNVVQMKNTEIYELQQSNYILHAKADEIEQTYEDSIPKFEYDQKVQYYESIVKECK